MEKLLHSDKHLRVITKPEMLYREISGAFEFLNAESVEITPILKGLDSYVIYRMAMDGYLVFEQFLYREGDLFKSLEDEKYLKKIMNIPKRMSMEVSKELYQKGLVVDGKVELRGRVVVDKSLYKLETGFWMRDELIVVKETLGIENEKNNKTPSELSFSVHSVSGELSEISNMTVTSKIRGMSCSTMKTGKKMYMFKGEDVDKFSHNLSTYRKNHFKVESLKITLKKESSIYSVGSEIGHFLFQL